MAEVISSGKVIQKPEIILDETDFLPPGIIGVRTKTRDEASTSADSAEWGDDEDEYSPVPNRVMPVPNDMTIVSQKAVVGPDRKLTLNVVIETADFPGIQEFEARVTKL